MERGKEEIESIRNFILDRKIFNIKVIARSSEDKISLENDILKIKIREIPEDGKANKAIVKLFSKTFKIPQSLIEIVSGSKNSNKVLKINLD